MSRNKYNKQSFGAPKTLWNLWTGTNQDDFISQYKSFSSVNHLNKNREVISTNELLKYIITTLLYVYILYKLIHSI